MQNKYFKHTHTNCFDELKDIAAKNFWRMVILLKVKNYKIAFDENKTPKDISFAMGWFFKEKKNKPAILNDTTLQKPITALKIFLLKIIVMKKSDFWLMKVYVKQMNNWKIFTVFMI